MCCCWELQCLCKPMKDRCDAEHELNTKMSQQKWLNTAGLERPLLTASKQWLCSLLKSSVAWNNPSLVRNRGHSLARYFVYVQVQCNIMFICHLGKTLFILHKTSLVYFIWTLVAEMTQGLDYVIARTAQTLIFSRLIHLYLWPASVNEGGI